MKLLTCCHLILVTVLSKNDFTIFFFFQESQVTFNIKLLDLSDMTVSHAEDFSFSTLTVTDKELKIVFLLKKLFLFIVYLSFAYSFTMS